MKVIQFEEYGKSNVLKYTEVPALELGKGEVLVEVKGAGINFADVMQRYGTYLSKTPLPYIPGSEVAGVIKEIGEGVQAYKPGDRVVALTGGGGYAEYVKLAESQLVKIPDTLDFVNATGALLQGLTAYHTLKNSANMLEGETVLVHAAAGGVGTMAIQMAKIFGAGKIIATASNGEKLELASSLGADVLINYTEEEWDKQVMKHTDGKGVDIVLEMVGGDIFSKSIDCLAPFGRLVVYGRAGMEDSKVDPLVLMKKNTSVIGFWLARIMQRPELYKESITDLMRYLDEGKLKVIIGDTFPLKDAALAQDKLEGRASTGKIVLVP